MKKIFILVITLATICSCGKDNSFKSGTVSMNVVNASIDVSSFYVFFTSADSAYYLQQNPVYFGSNMVYAIDPGNKPLSIVSSSDTVKPLFESTLNLTPGAVYSLYLAGIGNQVDTLFVRDEIPVHADSAAGLRVVNLSPGSQPITINLEGNAPDQTEFPVLGYKQITDFKSYSGSNGITYYNFEVRDQATGNLLTTFSWNFSLHKSYTLIIDGSEDPNSSTPLGLFTVNNF